MSRQKVSGRSKRYYESESDSSDDGDEGQRQCNWIPCMEAARKGSKYCSEECGIKLATHRITVLLPNQLEGLKTSVADQKDKEKLKQIQEQIEEQKNLFGKLESNRDALEKFIDLVNQIPCKTGDGESSKVDEGQGTTYYCVLCGSDVGIKNYVPHIERCFNRIEKDVSFVGYAPAQEDIAGRKMFCDFFNPKTGIYCKRFHALCAQHNKTKRSHSDDSLICGSPYSVDLDLETACRTAKSKCTKHVNWQNLRRAEIDLQKLNALKKHDSLFFSQREVEQAMKNRRSVLGLLLNGSMAAPPEDLDKDETLKSV